MTGFSNDQHAWGGTYHHSHTYFDAAVQTVREEAGDFEERQPQRIRFQANRHADFNFRTHVNTFSSIEPNQEQGRKEWMRALRSGDRIQLLAKAKYPAWRNYVQSARITVRYHEMSTEEGKSDGVEEIPEKLHDLRMLEQIPSHRPGVVIYHQSLHAENGILTSLRPLVRERTGVTAVILGTFRLCKKSRDTGMTETENNSGTVIYLNEFAIDDPNIDDLWVDIEYLHRESVKVIGMLTTRGGNEMAAAKGTWLETGDDATFSQSYKILHNLVISKRLDGFEFDLESDMPQAFTDTTRKDSGALGRLNRLINKLHADFGPNFIIAVTASANVLLGANGNKPRSGIGCYRTLECQDSKLISWYHVKVFTTSTNNRRNDDQDQMQENHFPRSVKGWRVEDGKTDHDPVVSQFVRELGSYIRLLQDKVYPSNKLLMSLSTTPNANNAVSESSIDHGVYIDPAILTSLLSLIRWSYSPLNFGGVAGWEYSSPSAVASRELKTAAANKRFESPWIWVRETKEVLENVFLS